MEAKLLKQLTNASTKTEELEFLDTVVKQAGEFTYMGDGGLFRKDLVEWVKVAIQGDRNPDIWSEWEYEQMIRSDVSKALSNANEKLELAYTQNEQLKQELASKTAELAELKAKLYALIR